MTVALLPLLRKADSPNVTVIASIAGLANQRYVSYPPSIRTLPHLSFHPLFPLLPSSLLFIHSVIQSRGFKLVSVDTILDTCLSSSKHSRLDGFQRGLWRVQRNRRVKLAGPLKA